MADQPINPAVEPFDYVPRMPGESDPARMAMVMTRLRSAAHTDLSPRRENLRDLADTVRLLIGRLAHTDAPDDVIEEATARLGAIAGLFADHGQQSVYGFSEMATSGGDHAVIFDHSPLIGLANPLAPPMTLTVEDEVVIASVTFTQAYEGPPGCVHGGYVAAAFDEVLGAAQSFSGAPGMTGTLTVRYESPTPLQTELRYEGRLVGVERRKIFTEGRCFAGDRLTATAKGTFIALNPGTFLDLIAERARQPTP